MRGKSKSAFVLPIHWHKSFRATRISVDPTILLGFLLHALALAALTAASYIVTRAVLRQTRARMALAQEMVIGLSLWGIAV